MLASESDANAENDDSNPSKIHLQKVQLADSSSNNNPPCPVYPPPGTTNTSLSHPPSPSSLYSRFSNPRWSRYAIALKSGADTVVDRVPIQFMTFMEDFPNFIIIGEAPGKRFGTTDMLDVYTGVYNRTQKRLDEAAKAAGLSGVEGQKEGGSEGDKVVDAESKLKDVPSVNKTANGHQDVNSVTPTLIEDSPHKLSPPLVSDGKALNDSELNKEKDSGLVGLERRSFEPKSLRLQGDGETHNEVWVAGADEWTRAMADFVDNLNAGSTSSNIQGHRYNSEGCSQKMDMNREAASVVLSRRAEAVKVDESSQGWKLDAHKNLPGLQILYQRFPDADWYLMIDDDSYMFFDNLDRGVMGLKSLEKVHTSLMEALVLLCLEVLC
ncbi:hypothetical protein HDU76_004597 [Blyttiomyces sp. JEL0837]|nr:hypothetical protein HDU76_004597 [Blyttiomyces sp. JEL0837]